MNWLQTHGIVLLAVAYVFSLATSVMPPLPMGQGWWATWLYNIVQIFGANAGNLIKHTPAAKQLETLVGKSTETLPNGVTTVTELETQKETLTPKS